MGQLRLSSTIKACTTTPLVCRAFGGVISHLPGLRKTKKRKKLQEQSRVGSLVNFGGVDIFLKGTSSPKSTSVLGLVTKPVGGTPATRPTNSEDIRPTVMESMLTASSSPTGRVTFSRVFGQQCQLMEAGRMWPEREQQNLLVVEVCQCLSASSLSPCYSGM